MTILRKMTFLFVVLSIVSCAGKAASDGAQESDTVASVIEEQSSDAKEVSPATIGDIPLPDGFERLPITDSTSFAYFLRNLPLKPLGTPVYTCYGDEGLTKSAYAVIDGYAPGNEDLQQCADAIIRLRAEWLYKNKRYDEIAFHFTNGWLCEYKRWAEGERVHVSGNKTSWYKAFYTPDYSYSTFLQYLKMVFNYAGTLSLSRELRETSITAIQIGDVFIRGGSPGHAIIVVDVAKDVKWHPGDKCFLVAESYMPAQDIHIIINSNNYCERLSPWHLRDDVYRCGGYGYNFTTYTFSGTDLKRF